MPEHLPAPGPHPARPPREPVLPIDDDESDDLLDDLQEPEDDLDPLDDMPDDEPLPDAFELEASTPEPPDPFDAIDDLPEDDDLVFDDAPEVPEPDLDVDEPAILPWKTHARLPEHAIEVEAVLEPGRAITLWQGGRPGPLRVVLGHVDVVVEPEITEGPPALRVGRDILSGRILVES